MQFDDRLATVLRSAAHSEAAARTQFRQLLDLLGSMPHGAESALVAAAYARLDELAADLPQTVQSSILRAPGLRLRNRVLVAWLAQGEPQAAAATMAMAQLSESDWLYLIPRLPLTARGFLRHRRDLPFSARQVLERLGVTDLVLPHPEPPRYEYEPAPELQPEPGYEPELLNTESLWAELAAPTPTPPDEPVVSAEADAGIGALVRRIEAFQRARREGGGAPRLPLGDAREFEREDERRTVAFDFVSDSQGVVTWADPAMAPLVVGLRLRPPRPGAVATLNGAAARALGRRLPLRGATATFVGVPEIAGAWRIDAVPMFAPESGHFAGYRGRMRRQPGAAAQPLGTAPAGAADRVRQLLHELRTPVNAIQGYAELIQQQMFGAAPNEYRALAAAVAVDAARVMAGFDEIDRLARLETGALALEPGQSDWREIVAQTLRRLEGVLRPRSARIELVAEDASFPVAIERNEALQIAWRLLATLAGALAPGEIVELELSHDGARLTMEAELPGAMLSNGDLFGAAAPPQARPVSAGMFGSGFTLRLARAEAQAAGGGLERRDDRLRLVLPLLTGTAEGLDRADAGGSSAA